MSTIAPHTVRAIAPPIEARGAMLLDAPVSGSVSTVEKGELTIMVGGDPLGPGSRAARAGRAGHEGLPRRRARRGSHR